MRGKTGTEMYQFYSNITNITFILHFCHKWL